MAKLNEEFNLSFHEVDSSIHIGFGENEAALLVENFNEIVPIPIQFEESTSRIPVNIADTEQVPTLFGDIVILHHGGQPGDDYYTKLQTDALLETKVDKIPGKGLSTNDLTDELVQEIHSGAGHQEIRVYNDRGVLSDSQIEILKQSPSNFINYLGQIFKLRFKSSSFYKYFSEYADVNSLPMITVNFTEKTYEYALVINGVLQEHISNNERHINSGERTFWNNKLNCEIVQNERLILNRN